MYIRNSCQSFKRNASFVRKSFTSANATGAAGDAAASSLCSYSNKHRNIEYNRTSGRVTYLGFEPNQSDSILFQTVVGLEIHAQLNIPTKLFSNASTVQAAVAFKKEGVRSNECVTGYDMAYPGTLPSISLDAVRCAVLSAHALNCCIHPVSRFERKHYTYADMPNGYQVTQQRWPIASNGYLECELDGCDGQLFNVGISRVQLEQDSGKTIYDDKRGHSLVDLNRAGSALIEIVFDPDVRSASQAGAVVSAIQDILKYIGTCTGKMEEGALRCDLNISIAPIDFPNKSNKFITDIHNPFLKKLPPNTGHRVEVKNLNSISQVINATEFEVARQVRKYVEGNPTGQETRTFDVMANETVLTRRKEGAIDYRFMPEPDLPPLVLNETELGGVTLDKFLKTIHELPIDATERLKNDYGLIIDTAQKLTCDPKIVRYFEMSHKHVQRHFGTNMIDSNISNILGNWITNDLFGLLKDESGSMPNPIPNIDIDAEHFGTLVWMVLDEMVSSRTAKTILDKMFHKKDVINCPMLFAKENGLQLISNENELNIICQNIVNNLKFSAQLSQYHKGGKNSSKAEKFFMGQVMKGTKGQAQPNILAKVLRSVLNSSSEK